MFFSYTILFLLQPPPHHTSLVSRLQTGWAWQRLSGCVPTTRGCPGCVRKGAEVPTTDAVLPFPLVTGHWGHQEVESRRWATWICIISRPLSPPLRKGMDNPDFSGCQGDRRCGHIVNMFHFCLNLVNVLGIARKLS